MLLARSAFSGWFSEFILRHELVVLMKTLAASAGQVFLRTHKNLYCFEAKK